MKMFFILFLCTALASVAATNYTVTVKSSGGTYNKLNDAEAGEQGDFVAMGRQLTIECYEMSDTTAVIVNGSVSTNDAYILIKSSSSGRHTGVWSDSKYKLDVSSGNALTIQDEYVCVDGIQVRLTRSVTDPRYAITLIPGNYGTNIISSCIIVGVLSGVAASCSGVRYNGGGTSALWLWNNLIIDWTGGSGSHRGIEGVDFKSKSLLLNNTIVNCNTGILRTAGTASITNCLFSGCTADASGTISDAYCATSNDNTKGLTAAGTGNRFSQTFTFTGSGDYHLASNDAGARNYGANLSASFTTDIDGSTRPGESVWDIGADEYIPPAATVKSSANIMRVDTIRIRP